MALTRVMLGAMPTLLGDIVRETLAGHEDIEILAEVADRGDIGPAVQRTGAQVAVVAVAPRGRSSDQGDLARELLAAHPHLKIVALTSDGRSG